MEVAPNERPPVCKVMDFGKFKYSQKKRASKQKQHQVQVKEIRVRPKTGDHDIDTKVAKAREFLEHNDKVQVNVLFRGNGQRKVSVGYVADAPLWKPTWRGVPPPPVGAPPSPRHRPSTLPARRPCQRPVSGRA